MKYGLPPMQVGKFDIDLKEYMFYMYYPIKFPESKFKWEERLEPFSDLIYRACIEIENHSMADITDKYIYLTVKHMFHPKGISHNRPGWHSDGFGTEDINYIWANNTPTEFCIQDYNITNDDKISLQEFQEQSKEENIITYPNNTLLRLTPANIHRIGIKQEDGPRIFVKISISKNKYCLKGNTHNYLFDYNWDVIERSLIRNTP